MALRPKWRSGQMALWPNGAQAIWGSGQMALRVQTSVAYFEAVAVSALDGSNWAPAMWRSGQIASRPNGVQTKMALGSNGAQAKWGSGQTALRVQTSVAYFEAVAVAALHRSNWAPGMWRSGQMAFRPNGVQTTKMALGPNGAQAKWGSGHIGRRLNSRWLV